MLLNGTSYIFAVFALVYDNDDNKECSS